jgi:hypothetical protein
VGAVQRGADYEMGWSLSHWLDDNRQDVWYVGLEVAVESNNKAFNDFDSAGLASFCRSLVSGAEV